MKAMKKKLFFKKRFYESSRRRGRPLVVSLVKTTLQAPTTLLASCFLITSG